MIKLIVTVLISLFVGYVVGKIRAHLKARWQCPDCGSFDTYLVSWCHGGVEGGEYDGAVKYWEYHCCHKCDARVTVEMKKVRDHIKPIKIVHIS